MKYLKHKFYEKFSDINIEVPLSEGLIGKDYCIYCERTVIELYPKYNLTSSKEEREQMETNINSNNKCLTEEEYLIKRLLE